MSKSVSSCFLVIIIDLIMLSRASMIESTGEPVWECAACNEQQSRSVILEVPCRQLWMCNCIMYNSVTIATVLHCMTASTKCCCSQGGEELIAQPDIVEQCARWWRGWRSNWRRCLTVATHLSGRLSFYNSTKNFTRITSFLWRWVSLYLSLYFHFICHCIIIIIISYQSLNGANSASRRVREGFKKRKFVRI